MSALSHDGGDKNPDNLPPKKSPGRIFRHEVAEGLTALDRSSRRLFVSALAAGLELSLSLLLIAIVRTQKGPPLEGVLYELLLATMYSFGFIVVVVGRSELFTEQTTLAIMPLLTGRTTLGEVIRLWITVYIGNIIGAVACAGLLVAIAPRLGTVDRAVFAQIALQVVDHPLGVVVVSGILAGWMMGLVSWLVAAMRDTISQIVVIWMVTSAIGFSHLHHAIAGAAEIAGGLWSGGGPDAAQGLQVIGMATLGNAIGGACFVALLKFGHAAPEPRK